MKRIVVVGIRSDLCSDSKHVMNQHYLTTLFDEVVQFLGSQGFVILPSGTTNNGSDFDVAVYTSRHWLAAARNLKSNKPDKTVILLVGVVKKYDDADGVLPVCCSGVDRNERLLAAIHGSVFNHFVKGGCMTTEKERKVPASNFLGTVAANVDNEKLSDAEFREFIRNTLPIVIYDGCEQKSKNDKDGTS